MKTRKFKIFLGTKENEVEVIDFNEAPTEDVKPGLPFGEEFKILVGNKEYDLKIEEIITPPPVEVKPPPPKLTPPKVEKEIVKVEGKLVKAPLTGTITKILVKVGDEVKQEQHVVVLEAMKMENLIESSVSGVVKDVRVSVGDKVTTGATLVILR